MADGPERSGNIDHIIATKDANGVFLPVNRTTTQTVRAAANTALTGTLVPAGATEVTIWATTASDGTAAAAWAFGGITPSSGVGTGADIPSAFGPVRFGCAGAYAVYTAAQSGTVDIYLMWHYSPADDWEA